MKSPSSAYITSFNDVTSDNLRQCVFELLNKLKSSSHMAIDFEFTGLCKPSTTDMNHRYIAMKETVEKYSIVSFGVSVVKEKEESIPSENDDVEKPAYSVCYECDNFNFLTKKEGKVVFQEGNKEFLKSTGFNFDRLYKEGIPFTPPGDIGKDDHFLHNKQKPRDTRLIKLWRAITSILKYNNIPLIVHNGLHDIMYLYHSFIDRLPNTFTGFLVALSQHFPSGFFDTKLLSIEIDYRSNFLAYVFAKSDRLRQNRFTTSSPEKPYFDIVVNDPVIHSAKLETNHTKLITSDSCQHSTTTLLTLPTVTYTTSTVTTMDRKRKKDEMIEVNTLSISTNNKKQKNNTNEIEICKAFAARGWCEMSKTGNVDHSDCGRLHDIQRIMDYEMGSSIYPQVYTSDPIQMKQMERAHAAHFDAYMTAFVFCYFKHTFTLTDLHQYFNKIRIEFPPFALTIPDKSKKNP